MNDIFAIISIIFAIILAFVYLGDGFALLFRDVKQALADGKLTKEELDKIEADARIIVKGILKIIRLFRSLEVK